MKLVPSLEPRRFHREGAFCHGKGASQGGFGEGGGSAVGFLLPRRGVSQRRGGGGGGWGTGGCPRKISGGRPLYREKRPLFDENALLLIINNPANTFSPGLVILDGPIRAN